MALIAPSALKKIIKWCSKQPCEISKTERLADCPHAPNRCVPCLCRFIEKGDNQLVIKF